MNKCYKVALAIDGADYEFLKDEVDAINDLTAIDIKRSVTTPDNTYVCVYWDCICWDNKQVRPLLAKLETIRHALITISEEGELWSDIETCDERGTDEEFCQILSWTSDICFWEEGAALTPVPLYFPYRKCCVPLSRERALQILCRYVENDLRASAESEYIYNALSNAGATEEEITDLGFGFCI